MSTKEIAAQDGVKEETVKESIRDVEIHEHLYSAGHLEAVQIETIIRNEERASKALGAALRAEFVTRDPTTLKKISIEPDHDTRLAAIDRLNAKANAVFARHKPTPGTTVNVGVGVNVAAGSQGRSYEERLRTIQSRRKAELPASVGSDDASNDRVIDMDANASPAT